MVNGNTQALQNVGAGLGPGQIVPRAADDHLAAMIYKAGESRAQIEQHGAVVHHSQHIDAKAGFQRRVLVQGIDDNVRYSAALEVNNHADALAVRFVPQVGNAVYLVIIDEGRNLFHQHGLVEAKGNFADDHGLQALFALLHLHAAAHLHGTAPGVVGIVQPLAGIDKAARGKVRSLDHVHEVIHAGLRIVQQHLQGIAQFPEIVRWNIGGHAHGNTRRAVEQQIGHLGGQN